MDIRDRIPALRSVIREIRTSLHDGTRTVDVLDLVARKATEVLGARGAIVRVLNLDTQEFEASAAFGLDERYLSKGPATNRTHILELCERNEVAIITDILTDPRVQCPQEAWDEGIRMMLDAPLIVRKPLVGLLRFHFADQKTLGQVEMNFVVSIAEQCASAIDKAQLIETQRIQYDQLALQTEKLSALGRMAAGIAHEINNPLAGILLHSSNLLKKVPENGPLRGSLQIIVDETLRCRGIIQNLLEFSRHNEPDKALTDVNVVIGRALAVLDNEFRLNHTRLDKDLSGELPSVLMDANQMEQVVVNLLLNALEAIGEGGSISIASRIEPGGQALAVEIADTGCGIPEEQVSRIFEPFFSTKAKGTGLGLSVSHGIVQNHQGRISVDSRPGEGTRFTIVLPLSSGDPPGVVAEAWRGPR